MDRRFAPVFIAVMIVASCAASATSPATAPASAIAVAPDAASPAPGTPRAPAAGTLTPEDQANPLPKLVPLDAIVDGDTIKARISGRLETIRVIGMDTPEVVDRRRPVQCFGREASARARQLLDGQNVALVADSTQTNRDKYERLLRYVEPERGGDFGLWMIANGYAHEYTYRVPYQRQAQYKAAQASAMRQNLGFWSATTCNGDTTKAAKER